jgi:hypothetical protein
LHHITLAEILSTNITDFIPVDKLRSGLLPSGSTRVGFRAKEGGVRARTMPVQD